MKTLFKLIISFLAVGQMMGARMEGPRAAGQADPRIALEVDRKQEALNYVSAGIYRREYNEYGKNFQALYFPNGDFAIVGINHIYRSVSLSGPNVDDYCKNPSLLEPGSSDFGNFRSLPPVTGNRSASNSSSVRINPPVAPTNKRFCCFFSSQNPSRIAPER